MKNIYFQGRLYTNESYQQYFRRRVANIISKYCEDFSKECVNIKNLERVKQNISLEIDDKYYSLKNQNKIVYEDEDEPIFQQENVIILKVIFDEKNRTDVYFVITKNLQTVSLNPSLIIEPSKIKYIMSSQLAPLSRVLGGIRIEELNLKEMKKKRIPSSENNTKLLIFVGIVLLALVICYFIAIFTLIR